MFDILNALYIGVMLVSSINLYSEADFKFPEQMDAVVEVSAHREWWREDGKGKCSFKGIMVPFARDWDEVDESTYPPITRAATPDKREGHVIVINRKVCKSDQGDVVTPMFSAGPIWRTWNDFKEMHQVVVQDMVAMKPENKPQWLPGVMARIERVAATDPAAKEFLGYLAASAETLAKQVEGEKSDEAATSPDSPTATAAGDAADSLNQEAEVVLNRQPDDEVGSNIQ